MSIFLPQGTKIPSSNNFQTLTVTKTASINSLEVNSIKTDILTDNVATLYNGYLTGLNDPITLNGAATKKYVDDMISDIIWKQSCRLATVILQNLPLFGLPVIDGIQSVIGDRILVKNQINGVENGYYVASDNVWNRAFDMQDNENVGGYTTIIREGTDNGDTAWVCTNNQYSDIVGTDILYFSKFTGSILAGAGLSQIGEMINVNTDNIYVCIDIDNNISLINTTVIPETYGSSYQTPVFTVDSKGRLTNAMNVNIQDASGVQKGFVTIYDQSFSGIKSFDNIHTPLLSGLSNPIGNTDAVNKAYVDAIATGLYWTDPASVLANTAINLIVGGLLTIDGVTLVDNSRVLVIGGSTANPNVSNASIDNGIYLAHNGSWTRASDMLNGSEISGYATYINNGDVYANSGFVCNNTFPSDTVGVNNLQWVQFACSSEILAGYGLTKTGNTLSVNVDNVGIQISGNNLQLKDGGVTSSKLSNTTVITGSYGSATQVPSFTVDMQGRITSANNITISSGDVYGPIFSSVNAITTFANTTGKLIKNSSVTIDDTGNMNSNGSITLSSTIDATSSTSGGTFTTAGGLAIGKNLYVGSNINIGLGSVTIPSISFSGDTNTGIYSSVSDTIDFSTSGVNRMSISSTTITNTLPILVPIGTVTSPTYSFSGDTNTGIYSSVSDTIGFSTAGVNRMSISSTTITNTIPMSITNSTDATSSSSGGSFTTSGGAAIAKKLFVGDNLFVLGAVGGGIILGSAGNATRTISAADNTTGNGTALNLNGGNSTVSGGGGAVSITGGTGISGIAGGTVSIQGGTSDTGSGGLTRVVGGNATGSGGTGGSVIILSGTSGSSPVTTSGSINLTTPLGSVSSGIITMTTGGTLRLTVGTGSLTSTLPLSITNSTDATSSSSGGSFTTSGGAAISRKLFLGDNFIIGSEASTKTITTPSATTVTAAGGSLSIITGNGGSTSGNSGTLTLSTGTVTSGTVGNIILQTAGSTVSTISTVNITNTIPMIISNNTSSTSSSTGALTLTGGIGINNATDANSFIDGGSFTTAGGMSIAKKLFIGDNITLGTAAGTVRIIGGLNVSSGTGVGIAISAGDSSNGAGGNITINPGDGTTTNVGGSTTIRGGSSVSGSGGGVNIIAGNATGAGIAGNVTITSGTSNNTPNTTSGNITLATPFSNIPGNIIFNTGGSNRVTIGTGITCTGRISATIGGNAEDPSYTFSGASANTGFYSPSANILNIVTQAAIRINIDSQGIISFPKNTTSSSSTSGSVLFSGGLSINNATDAVSSVNGGTITTAGGAAIAKSLWVGTSINTPTLILSNKTSYVQLTSSGTPVPITTSQGFITTYNLTTMSGLTTTFAITSSLLSSTSLVSVTIDTYSGIPITDGIPIISVSNYGSSTADIKITNYGINSLSGILKFNYIIL